MPAAPDERGGQGAIQTAVMAYRADAPESSRTNDWISRESRESRKSHALTLVCAIRQKTLGERRQARAKRRAFCEICEIRVRTDFMMIKDGILVDISGAFALDGIAADVMNYPKSVHKV